MIFWSVVCEKAVRDLVVLGRYVSKGTYAEKLQEWLAEGGDDMIDFKIELVGAEERSPSCEDRMCNLKDAPVDFGVGFGESADEFLEAQRSEKAVNPAHQTTNLSQCVPSSPEVGVSDDADSFSKLCLDGYGTGDHKADQALFDDLDLLLRDFVVAISVLIAISESAYTNVWMCSREEGSRTT